jgi:hypothetical protein
MFEGVFLCGGACTSRLVMLERSLLIEYVLQERQRNYIKRSYYIMTIKQQIVYMVSRRNNSI